MLMGGLSKHKLPSSYQQVEAQIFQHSMQIGFLSVLK